MHLHHFVLLIPMASGRSKSIRFEDDPEVAKLTPSQEDHSLKLSTSKINQKAAAELQLKKSGKQKNSSKKSSNNLKKRELLRVFSEDYEAVKRMILNPRGSAVNRWNEIFLVACLVSLFVDPLFFYLPKTTENLCVTVYKPLQIALVVVRSLTDAFYFTKIFVRLRTAYVVPSSRVFGRAELVIDPSKVASNYLYKHFWLDMVAALPFPQVLLGTAIIPHSSCTSAFFTRIMLRIIIMLQYLVRLYLIFPLSSEIIKSTGVMMEKAWAGAAYNLMLYMLASHVIGACWYLLSVERQEECWREVCSHQQVDCHPGFFDCRFDSEPNRSFWLKSSNVSSICDPSGEIFGFGIYADAVSNRVTGSRFVNKYLYCLWWGLRNLSSLGQNLLTSSYVGEVLFSIGIAILGLVLFGLLIGNMQTYLQSITVRLEEWRVRRTDMERWMHHRQLPQELRQSVRKYDQYRWVATRGVDEEAILKGLPLDLRRDIKRHLCLDLVRQVPLFDMMDERMLDAICERLRPCLYTSGSCLVREGDPVNDMLFILRGHLDSYTTNGGRTGFFNSCRIGAGDFCGEELLTWALHPRPTVALPSSTRTVKAITEIEAFALVADDLKFVASQFRRLHSKQLRHTFRFHSPQWRTWAACFIQAAWFRYKRRKEAAELKIMEGLASQSQQAPEPKASSFIASTRGGRSKRCGSEFDILTSLRKPTEPDFITEEI